MKTTRLDDESARAYEAFRAYAEMTPKRSLRAVAHKLSKSPTIIKRWSSRHKWKLRIIQWDLEHADMYRSAEQKAAEEHAKVRESRRKQVQDAAWSMFEKLKEKAAEMLAFPVGRRTITEKHEDGKDKITIIEPVRWRFSDLARVVEIADALGRLSTGMPSKVTGLSDPDGKPFTMPSGGGSPTTVIVNVAKDAESEEAVALFGERAGRR